MNIAAARTNVALADQNSMTDSVSPEQRCGVRYERSLTALLLYRASALFLWPIAALGELRWVLHNMILLHLVAWRETLDRKSVLKKPLKQRQIWRIRFFLGREGRMRDRALFGFVLDSKLRGYDLVKIKNATLVRGQEIRKHAVVILQKKRDVQLNLKSRRKSGQAYLYSLNEEVGLLMTSLFLAGLIKPIILALAIIPG